MIIINNEIIEELKNMKLQNKKFTIKKMSEHLKEKYNIEIKPSTLSKKLKSTSNNNSNNNSNNSDSEPEENNGKSPDVERDAHTSEEHPNDIIKLNAAKARVLPASNNSLEEWLKNDDSISDILEDCKTNEPEPKNERLAHTNEYITPNIKINLDEREAHTNENNNLEKSIIKNVYNPNNKFDENETFEKRKTIIIIRQYLATFNDKLNYLFGKNKQQYEKSLYTYDLNKLKNILESIRCELALSKNKNITKQITETILYSYEKGMKYTGINLDGITSQLMNDPDFMYDVQMLSCEVDLTSYLNPKTNILLKIAQQSYILYSKNKMEDKLNELLEGVKLQEKTN